MNLAASDKSKLKNEIDELIAEQNKLQAKVNQLALDKDEEDNKNRQLEREINELNIQLNANRVTSNRYSAADENDQRVQELRDEIAKKSVQISQAQREYKHLLDNPPAKRKEQYQGIQDENDDRVGNSGPSGPSNTQM